MFVPQNSFDTDEDRYASALEQLRALTAGECSDIANLANASALLNITVERINWVGFYLFDGIELVLGPFQGLPACIRIPLGKGVCGTAALERRTIVVPDVHAFPGHIACDSASQSEIVVPLFRGGNLFGVLDVDSPELNRFSKVEKEFFEAAALILFP